MRGKALAAITLSVAAALSAAPAYATPVSDSSSESPFIDAFYHRLNRLGYGYLDPAWQVMDAAWMACGMKDVPGSVFDDAVAVVVGRGYTPEESTAIAQAASTHLCN